MQPCSQCEGFIPESAASCPNCHAAPVARARTSRPGWLTYALTAAGASVASVTLSACYGSPCATVLPDGGQDRPNATCIDFDCTKPLADGGDPRKDTEWHYACDRSSPFGDKADGGVQDGGQ